MNSRVRMILFAASALLFAGLLLRASGELPHFGLSQTSYASLLNAVVPGQRQVPNVPTAVNYDYRGFDTLGEEFILFTAILGLGQMLSHGLRVSAELGTDQDEPLTQPPDRSEAVRLLAAAAAALVLVLGINVVAHGQLTPGSGFQGGVMLSGALLLVYLGFGADVFARMTPERLIEPAESLAAAGYVVCGLLGVFAGSAFLANVLKLGQYKSLISGGTTSVINLCVGLEVFAAFVVAYAYLLRAARVRPSAPSDT